MKITHHNADHRLTLIRNVQLFYTDPDTQDRVMLYLYTPNDLFIKPHVQWGIEAEFEPIEQQGQARDGGEGRKAG